MKFENLGSLITLAGTNQCLGYLMDFKEKGIYDAEYGKLEISPEQATIHNQCLDKALIEGLDNNCKCGQGNSFYYVNKKVTTFNGTVVADTANCIVKGRSITFYRLGKCFRGTLQKDGDYFNFKRIS